MTDHIPPGTKPTGTSKERSLPALLREAERRVNQHVWGDRRAIVSIPARRDEDVDLLLMEAADEIEGAHHDITRLMDSLTGEVNESQRLRELLWDILDDLSHRSSKRDANGCAVLDLGATLVRRADDAIERGNEPTGNETSDVAVAGDSLSTSLAMFQHKCSVHIGNEQVKPNPNNALIDTLCEAIRLCRENEQLARAPLKAFVQLCAPHGKDWLTCPECAKAAAIGNQR